jgi:hypothetical protein
MAILNPCPGAADQRRAGQLHVGEPQRGQGMRRDHVEPLGDLEPRRAGGHDEGRQARAPGASPVRANSV